MTDTDPRALVERLTGFTPGPWISFPMHGPRVQTNFARVFAADDDLRYIADCRDSMNFFEVTDNEANAALIAAAPDLHAALTAALDAKEKAEVELDDLKRAVRHANDHADQAISDMKAALARTEAALTTARAEGRADGLREAIRAASTVGRPVGCGDGDTYIPGTSGQAVAAIRALLEGDDT